MSRWALPLLALPLAASWDALGSVVRRRSPARSLVRMTAEEDAALVGILVNEGLISDDHALRETGVVRRRKGKPLELTDKLKALMDSEGELFVGLF